MLTSLPFALVQHVLSFSDATTTSAVMCSSKELRDAVSATMAHSKTVVFNYSKVIVKQPFNCSNPAWRYGPTLKQWLGHYTPAVTSMSLRDCQFLTDESCKLLAARFPLLERLDLSGCQHMTSVGVKMFARGCTSLSHFRCNVTTANSMCKHMRVNGPYIKALAESKSLHVLSLLLGSKNRADALASLQLHPALRELNLFSTGYSDVSLDVHLPFLKRLRLYRQARSANFWRDFFQALCKGGNGGNGGTVPNPLCNLPNLQFLLINFAHRHNNNFNSPMLQLLSPGVQAALPRSKLVSIVVRPCTDEQLSQWQALGPLNSLGQPISLKKGKKWPWGREGKGHWYRAQI